MELVRVADRTEAKQPAGCSATATFACICRGGLHSHSSEVVYHPAIHFCMMHVLTGMCSRRVRRMCSWHNFSSTERAWKLPNAALHRPRAAATARGGVLSFLAIEFGRDCLHPHAAAVLDGDGGALLQLLVARERLCGPPAQHARCTLCQGRVLSHYRRCWVHREVFYSGLRKSDNIRSTPAWTQTGAVCEVLSK